MYTAIDTETGEDVGDLWVHVEEDKKRAFLFDIIVYERFGRSGYGRAMLDSPKAKVRYMHVAIIGLHVFDENEVAFDLYKKQGYCVISYDMQKEL